MYTKYIKNTHGSRLGGRDDTSKSMEKTNNLLIEAGLSEEQALIYEALLDKGPQRASSLADWTGVKRGLTYKVLEQLEAIGLVEKKGGQGSVAVFVAGHPSLLMGNIERKEKELSLAKDMLEHSLGSLASKYNLIAGKPNVQFYEGKDAISKITSDLPEKDTEIRQIMDMELAMNQFPEETVSHLKKRIAKGVQKRMILSDSSFNTEYAKKGTELTSFRTATGVKTFPTAILTYDNKTSMLTFSKEKVVGLIIEDKEIAETMKIVFGGYWKNSEPIAGDVKKSNSSAFDE